MSENTTIFDPVQRRRQRDRASVAFAEHDFLMREVAERLAERLDGLNRNFPMVLDLGCHTGGLRAHIMGKNGIAEVVECDLSSAMVAQAGGGLRLVADEERLPFAEHTFDAVFSVLSLQGVNDLPGVLIQARQILKPDGLFLAALIGGESLTELRQAMLAGEIAEEGGAAPRVAPMVDAQDAARLLQRAGFALPVVESETITATYSDALSLMLDLRGMGEGNALVQRPRRPMKRNTLAAILSCYHEQHENDDGRIPARFDIITLTGWKPDASQQQPAARGSATVSLRAVLEQK
ncbi:MAG: methyltransferase domain-containing protein [Alphaproteobacteria bacterium]|nr:methyltransferase domain-containing protein [Alphaproteobacteria bacterium]